MQLNDPNLQSDDVFVKKIYLLKPQFRKYQFLTLKYLKKLFFVTF